MSRPFSVVVTYNSEGTIRYTLESIRNQKLPQDKLEILVIDGRSTDRTREKARENSAIVLDNKKKRSEFAKAMGVTNASRRYIIRMDSDEEFVYDSQLQDKKDFYMNHPNINALLGNQYVKGRKDICGLAAYYMNILGTFFIFCL